MAIRAILRTATLRAAACCFTPLLACCMPEGVLQHNFVSLPADGWQRRDTLLFDIDSAAQQVWLCVRIDATYPYTTLSLLAGKDTVTISVEQMKGRSLRQCEFPLTHFRHGPMKIIHLMRDTPLHGVREVGTKTSSINQPSSLQTSLATSNKHINQ